MTAVLLFRTIVNGLLAMLTNACLRLSAFSNYVILSAHRTARHHPLMEMDSEGISVSMQGGIIDE